MQGGVAHSVGQVHLLRYRCLGGRDCHSSQLSLDWHAVMHHSDHEDRNILDVAAQGHLGLMLKMLDQATAYPQRGRLLPSHIIAFLCSSRHCRSSINRDGCKGSKRLGKGSAFARLLLSVLALPRFPRWAPRPPGTRSL